MGPGTAGNRQKNPVVTMNDRFKPALITLIAFLTLAAPGCSKSDKDDVAVDANGKSAPAAVPGKGDAAASQAISIANKAIEQSDYDAAIAALMAAKQSNEGMSDQQKDAYRQSLRDASTRLLEASRTDPKAMEAYQNLGRLMKGR